MKKILMLLNILKYYFSKLKTGSIEREYKKKGKGLGLITFLA